MNNGHQEIVNAKNENYLDLNNFFYDFNFNQLNMIDDEEKQKNQENRIIINKIFAKDLDNISDQTNDTQYSKGNRTKLKVFLAPQINFFLQQNANKDFKEIFNQ